MVRVPTLLRRDVAGCGCGREAGLGTTLNRTPYLGGGPGAGAVKEVHRLADGSGLDSVVSRVS